MPNYFTPVGYMQYNPEAGSYTFPSGTTRYNWMMDPKQPWNQLMNPQYLEQLLQSRLADWQKSVQQAGQNVMRSAASRWGGTGAEWQGIESPIPQQWYQRGMQDWMTNVGTPGRRAIEQEYLQGLQGARQTALQWLLSEMQQRRQMEAAQPSFWDYFSNILGMGASALPFAL